MYRVIPGFLTCLWVQMEVGPSCREDEFLVLQAIYGENFKQTFDNVIQIEIPDYCLTATFSLPLDYPISPPEISITSVNRLDSLAFVKFLLTKSQVMRGEPMIFNLMTLINDHVAEYQVATEKPMILELVDNSPSFTTIETRVIQQGTPVTRETFKEWHSVFLKECDPEAFSESVKTGRLTGRQLFEQKVVRVEETDLAADEADFDVSALDETLFLGLETLSTEGL